MAHGAPDYSDVVKPEFTHRLDDMAELAARLTNKGSMERRGETMFIETFDNGLWRWNKTSSGTGGDVELSTDYVVSGEFSCHLRTGSTSLMKAGITKYLVHLAVGKLGIEFRVYIDAFITKIDFYLSEHNGSVVNIARAKYYPQAGYVEIRDREDSYVTVLENIPVPGTKAKHNFIKLVADFANEQYQRIFINDNFVDLTDYQPQRSVYSESPYSEIVLNFHSDSGTNGDAYIDNIIYTRNE